MGIFKKKVSRSEKTVNDELEVLPARSSGYLGQAEQVANVVVAGLEKENYSGMNKQLATIVHDDGSREVYVFDHPGVIGIFVATATFVMLSIVYAYFIFIGVGASIFSTRYMLIGTTGIGVSLVVLLLNILLIMRFVSTIKYKNRFDVYNEILRFSSIEILDDLAGYSKQKELTIVRDLERAVKHKLIPQGHFSRDNLVFMVSDEIYDKYMQKPAVYDRYFKNQIEERKRMKSRTNAMNQIMDKGNKYIEKIHDFGSIIKEKSVSRKLEKMETIVSMIFHEIDINPSQAHSLGMFLNYYLPTTEKLLDAYASIGEKQIKGKNLSKAKKEIEEALDTIVCAFEGILEKLYEEHEMDIASDIAAMEIMMKQEGLPTES